MFFSRYPVGNRWGSGYVSFRIVCAHGIGWPASSRIGDLADFVLFHFCGLGPVELIGEVGSCEPIVCFWALVGGLCEALCPVENWGVSWFFEGGGGAKSDKDFGFGRAKMEKDVNTSAQHLTKSHHVFWGNWSSISSG